MKIDNRSGRRKNRVFLRLAALLLVAVALFFWLDRMMRPGVESIVAYQAKVFATRLVNESMIAQMERDDVTYSDLLHITRSEDGDVKSIEADMARINRFKAAISEAVIAKLSHSGARTVSIPLGTLVGNQLTTGHGPPISVKVMPTGYVQTEIFNKFSAAGINQTLHQVMLQVSVQMIAVLPGYSVSTETVTNFCIAETVIVGKIPQGYASIGESSSFEAFEALQK